MNLSLSGKRALVCGSTQGIGKAAAVELSKLGASITLIARNEEKLKETLRSLDTGPHQSHDYIVVDFNDVNQLKSKVTAYLQKKGPVEILINNTGGPPAGKIEMAKEEEFIQAFNNHLLCNHVLMLAVVEGMKASKYGRIINVISTSVKIPLKGLGVSNTIRAAVANWSKTLANELAIHQITVNNVLPGATNTQRLQGIIENKSKANAIASNEVIQEMIAEIPAGRFAEPEEVAGAIAFLASPAAAYITGINLPVDGGRTGSL